LKNFKFERKLDCINKLSCFISFYFIFHIQENIFLDYLYFTFNLQYKIMQFSLPVQMATSFPRPWQELYALIK